jgi:hypothetical protein
MTPEKRGCNVFQTNEELHEAYKHLAEEAVLRMAAGDYDGAGRIVNRVLRRAQGVRRPRRADRPRCGAMTRKGTPCKAPAVWLKGEPEPRNGRCRNHGGLSTGPRTEAGKAAIAASNRARAVARKLGIRPNEDSG